MHGRSSSGPKSAFVLPFSNNCQGGGGDGDSGSDGDGDGGSTRKNKVTVWTIRIKVNRDKKNFIFNQVI